MHRLHYRDLDEKERQNGENGGLDEAHENLEQHKGHRSYVGNEVSCDEDENLPRDDVAKKSEGEGDQPRDLRKELDNADDEPNDRMRIDEFGCVFEKTKYSDTGNLDDDERDDGERKSYIEVCVDAAQKRSKSVLSKKTNTAYARCEFEHVGCEYKKEERQYERKEAARERAAPERFCDVVVHKTKEPLEERLEPSGHHSKSTADHECEYDEKKDYDPAGQERVGDGKPKPFSQLFSRKRNVYSLFHGQDSNILKATHPSVYR